MLYKKMGDKIAIEHFVKTVSGSAVLKNIQNKRKKFEMQIDEALQKHQDELTQKQINTNKLKQELLVLAEIILERSHIIKEFFKFKVSVEDEKSTKIPKEKTTEDHLNLLDSFFKV